MSEMRGYDAWLEAPYQRLYDEVPPGVEDFLGVRFYHEEEDEWAEVVGYENWEDADEDGRYGGTDLVIRCRGREFNMTPDRVEELIKASSETLHDD